MPELRRDPVTGRWVIIAVERARRPSDFTRDPVVVRGGRICPFCPGWETKTPPEVLAFRNGSAANTPGWSLRVVPNKFPALRVEGEPDREGDGLYDRMNGIGAHEVFIETPDHAQTMSTFSEKQVEDLFWAFRDRIEDLKKDPRLRYVLLFKNHGEAAGATMEHTHSQLIALPVVPKRVQEEVEGAKRYFEYKERCVYCDILRQEIRSGERIVIDGEHVVALVPYAPRFPFETWILPKVHVSHFENITPPVAEDLARVMRRLARKLDRALELPAWNFMIHTTPIRDAELAHYHWHIELIPKLTRVAGFEWATGFYINPTPPEQAARFLREVED